MRETEKPDNSNKEHEQRKNNESSTKQVELRHLRKEIKYIKRTLDILLERQWLETPKDNKEGSTETKKSENQTETNPKTQKPNKEQSISSNREQEQKQEKVKEIQNKVSQGKEQEGQKE